MQADNPLLHTKHIFRIVILLVLGVVAIVLGRSLFVPDSFGQYGFYRGDNLEQQRSKQVRHGGDVSCQPCHAEQFETHEGGQHSAVRCESCHAPVVLHAVDGKKTADMPMLKARELCLRCHRQLDARPDSFPQIQARQHTDDHGGDWDEEVCFQCHGPHAPLE